MSNAVDLTSVNVVAFPAPRRPAEKVARSSPGTVTHLVPRSDAVDQSPASSSVVAPSRAEGRNAERSARVAVLLDRMVAAPAGAQRQAVQDAIVIECLGVARSIAARYRGRGVERADLEQLACLGLVKAVSRWRPGLSEDFLQFAVPTISGEVKRYFRDHSWLVRPPRRIQELRAAITTTERDLLEGGAPRPDDNAIARRLGVEPIEISEARAAAGLCRPPSIDAGSGAGSFIAEHWGGPDDTAAVDDRLALEEILGQLSERERRVVRMRFTEGLSQARIGQAIGVSQMQVSRILRDVLGKLRTVWPN